MLRLFILKLPAAPRSGISAALNPEGSGSTPVSDRLRGMRPHFQFNHKVSEIFDFITIAKFKQERVRTLSIHPR